MKSCASAMLTLLLWLPLLPTSAFSQSHALPPPVGGITVDQVIRLSQSGLSDSTIIAQVKRRPRPFDLTPEQLLRLKSAHVSDDVIEAMTAPASPGTAVAVSTPPPRTAPPLVYPPSASVSSYQPAYSVPAAPNVAQAPPPQVAIQQELPGRLTDEQVNAAIQRGYSGRGHQIGLRLVDQQEFFFSGLLCDTCQTSGYVITVYTPEQWVEEAAHYAKREMAPFTLADVPEEMRQPMLHVIAMPSTPQYLNGSGFSWASSVHRVVLSDTSRAVTIQPVDLSHGSVETNSAFRSASFTSATVSFYMTDVQKLRAADAKGEFFIVVVGDNKNKFFKVKERFMSSLFPNGHARSSSPQPNAGGAPGSADSAAGSVTPSAAAVAFQSAH